MASGFDEGYLNWLIEQIEPQRNLNPRRTHRLLLAQLHQTPYRVRMSHDRNREADGKELRYSFLGGYSVDASWEAESCSVLEMLIALSRHAAYQSYGELDDWFWHILDNLGLVRCTDEGYGEWVDVEVAQRLELFMSGEYGTDGRGGLFPLRFSNHDQRQSELWYQMAAYIMEGSGPRV